MYLEHECSQYEKQNMSKVGPRDTMQLTISNPYKTDTMGSIRFILNFKTFYFINN